MALFLTHYMVYRVSFQFESTRDVFSTAGRYFISITTIFLLISHFHHVTVLILLDKIAFKKFDLLILMYEITGFSRTLSIKYIIIRRMQDVFQQLSPIVMTAQTISILTQDFQHITKKL